MPMTFEPTFMNSTRVANYDNDAKKVFGPMVVKMGLTPSNSWCRYGWKDNPSASDYFLEVDDIGIVGGFQPGHDWNEHPFMDDGVYVWTVDSSLLHAEISMSADERLLLTRRLQSMSETTVAIAARRSDSRKPSAILFFDRKLKIEGRRITYYIGDIDVFNFGEPDENNGESIDLGGVYAAASIQMRADWAAIQYHLEQHKTYAHVDTVVVPLNPAMYADNTATAFYELIQVAVDQLYDNHAYRENADEECALRFADYTAIRPELRWEDIPH